MAIAAKAATDNPITAARELVIRKTSDSLSPLVCKGNASLRPLVSTLLIFR
jgi:hypothetical protein